MLSVSFGWGTRTRTRKGRTRICSVTITPYPKMFVASELSCSVLRVQRYYFFLNYQNFLEKIYKKPQFFLFFFVFWPIYSTFKANFEGTLHLGNANKSKFIWHFARFAVPLRQNNI